MSKTIWQKRKTIIAILFVTLFASAILPAFGQSLVQQNTASASSGDSMVLGNSALLQVNSGQQHVTSLTSSSAASTAGAKDLGANGYPATSSFASTVIGKYNIKWLRVSSNYPSYLIPAGFSLVVQLNSCSTSSSLAAAKQCYQNAVTKNPNVHVWELFNEPNNQQYQGGFQNGSPYNAYLLTQAAYQVIKAHNPNDQVLAPSISIFTYVSGNYISPSNYAWMAQYWAYGAKNYVTGVALHEYPKGLYNQVPKGATETNAQIISAGLDKYEALVQKPIWITETGCNQATQSVEATCLQQDFAMLFSKSYVQSIFWYDLSDFSFSGKTTTHWGLFDTSNNPKTQVLADFDSYAPKA